MVVTLIERAGGNEMFRATGGTKDLEISFWEDGTWATVWAVDEAEERGEELYDAPVRTVEALAEALVRARVPRAEALAVAEQLWPLSIRSRIESL